MIMTCLTSLPLGIRSQQRQAHRGCCRCRHQHSNRSCGCGCAILRNDRRFAPVMGVVINILLLIHVMFLVATIRMTHSYTPHLRATRTKCGIHPPHPPLCAKATGGGSRKSNSNTNTSNKKKGFGSPTSGNIPSTLTPVAASATSSKSTQQQQQQQQQRPTVQGTAPAAAVSKKQRDAMLQRLQSKYGGTTPSEIAAGTQLKMTEYIQQLPTHTQMAVQLYTKLQQYNTTISKLSIYQQTNMFNSQQMDQIRNDQQQLQDIYDTFHLSNIDIHNILQQMTWDTSAYAKMVKSQLGHMNPDIAQRIQNACSYIVDAVVNTASGSGRCLDVGCGYGALIPILTTTTTTTTTSATTTNTITMSESQINGIDISTEMIKYGRELYPDCHFVQGDFLQYHPTTAIDDNDGGYFDGIMFCSSLHDMPNIYLVLEKAISLLRNDDVPSSTTSTSAGSTIVIVHAQGAGHVQMQHVKNPILVPQLLPTAAELQAFIDVYNNGNVEDRRHHPNGTATKLQLTVAPAAANTPSDMADGYLAVMQKIRVS